MATSGAAGGGALPSASGLAAFAPFMTAALGAAGETPIDAHEFGFGLSGDGAVNVARGDTQAFIRYLSASGSDDHS